MLGVIAGSGLQRLAHLENIRREIVRTPFGETSCALTIGELSGVEVVFLNRHGYGHTLAPHQINYRANLWALQSLNLSRVISVASVGGIHADFTPGTVAIPDQIIDYTHSRKYTYYDGTDRPVTHIDFTEPYCPITRGSLLEAAKRANEKVIDGGVYGATQGPRLETAAEINRLERDGVDMVGMTGMPEAGLARELGLDYACLAIVANWAAGAGPDVDEVITLQDVLGNVAVAMDDAARLLRAMLAG